MSARLARIGFLLLAAAPAAAQTPQGTAFTYQGRLQDGASPADGTYDFQFILYDAAVGGSQVGPLVTRDDVAVEEGLFTLGLDFAAAFAGSKRWLEIGVRPGSSTGSYTPVVPRQELTSSPASLFSAAAPWAGVSGKPPGFADGVDNDSGGTVTSVAAGAGLSGGTITAAGTLAVSFGGSGGAATAARSDHNHDGAYAGTAHNHLGESWTGAPATGLQVSTSGLTGVRGVVTAAGGFASAVMGESASTSGQGVYGLASAASGAASGVRGTSQSPNGVGVTGIAGASSGGSTGVFGQSNSSAGTGVFGRGGGFGVWGSSLNGTGVFGFADGTSANYGVLGRTDSTSGRGVFGWATPFTGTNYGVYGLAQSGTGYAGYFDGRLHVTGTLSKGGGSFKIDHPLDPERRYLYHSFVESPDMKNVYDGVVTTDGRGFATVALPDWFEVLNRDFRYQLTAMGDGAWARARVHREIAENRFVIQSDLPETKVSWQVTGIRRDPFAERHRIPVEEDKPAGERGTYLHPEAWGQPAEKGLDHGRRPRQTDTPRPGRDE